MVSGWAADRSRHRAGRSALLTEELADRHRPSRRASAVGLATAGRRVTDAPADG